jgi:hypothetical protein
MNVLFNAAAFTADMRRAMEEEDYGSLKFYIVCILALGACVTVLGLVTTFTAWGMISAISESNSHYLLRSIWDSTSQAYRLALLWLLSICFCSDSCCLLWSSCQGLSKLSWLLW